MKTICIIGGGFSGSVTAMRLLDKNANLHVTLINYEHPLVHGIAFSTGRSEHLLNVPAGRMSAVHGSSDHFTNWLRSKPEYQYLITENLSHAFLPRAVYGVYLKELLATYAAHQQLEIIPQKALNVSTINNRYHIALSNGNSLTADALVLAMGNYLPAAPRISNATALQHPHYFKSPWNDAFLKNICDNETILLIGTGLTMVDGVLSLQKQAFKGKIIVVSPRGYIPASHTTPAVYPDFYTEYKNKNLLQIFQTVRKHLKIAAEKNHSWQSVIDSIRPYVQEIWLQLSKKEKVQFTSHLRHIWGVARHRLPESIYNQIDDAVKSGQLQIIGGRIINIEEGNNTFTVSIRPRKNQSIQQLTVTRIVNCTGPQINYSEINDELVKSLIANEIIYPDELKMGITALPNGQVLNKNGQPVKNVYALGSLLRGVLWETTAVPDIRVQTENVAQQIAESSD